MNQQQAKYTIERINSIEARKLADLKVEYTVPSKHITDDEIITLIATKKVKLKSTIKRSRYNTLQAEDIFDLSKHQWSEYQREGYTEAVAAVKAQAAKVRDEVMLGDNAEALRLLREFAA